MFRWDGELPSREQVGAYIGMLELTGLAALKGVHLYGVARPSFQPEAAHLQQLTADELDAVACQLKKKGLTVTVSP
jgi:hypothetical protein